MSVIINKVTTKDDLRKFIHFGIDLYESNEYFVPPLVYDERDTLSRTKNPAFDHCDASYFLAYRDEEIVGRIAVIINFKANEIWNERNARFGFVDFIDDSEVVDALLAQLRVGHVPEAWRKFTGRWVLPISIMRVCSLRGGSIR